MHILQAAWDDFFVAVHISIQMGVSISIRWLDMAMCSRGNLSSKEPCSKKMPFNQAGHGHGHGLFILATYHGSSVTGVQRFLRPKLASYVQPRLFHGHGHGHGIFYVQPCHGHGHGHGHRTKFEGVSVCV